MAERKKRGANYSQFEKEKLTELIDERRCVIEEKKHDVNNNERKIKAWDELTKAFNTDVRVVKRTTKQLQTLWRDMKTKAKKDRARFSREAYRATGGGPAPTPVDGLTGQIEAVLPTEFEGVSGIYDDDYEMAGEWTGFDATNSLLLIHNNQYCAYCTYQYYT